MSLITKYRPSKLDDFMGNQHVIASVNKMLSKDIKDIPHAWIFSGITGSGKTTLARIIAEKIGASPCGIFEHNASNDRGIDFARTILESSVFVVMGSKKTVHIFDECHQLTKDAQNAFLKVFEDPPEHAYFILCTTEDQKILPAVKNRCAAYKIEPMKDEDMADLIVNVCKSEGFEKTTEAVIEIIKGSHGSPRLALNLLEKCSGTNDLNEIKALVSGVDTNISEEGEFEVSGQIMKVLRSCNNSNQAWDRISGILQYAVYENKLNVTSIKQGLSAQLARGLLRNPNEGISQTILTLESTGYTMSKAVCIASILNVVSAYYEGIPQNTPR